MFIPIITIEIILLLITFNIITSYQVIKNEDLEKIQKLFQIIITWLLPFLGSFLIMHFLADNNETISRDETGNSSSFESSGGYTGGGGGD